MWKVGDRVIVKRTGEAVTVRAVLDEGDPIVYEVELDLTVRDRTPGQSQESDYDHVGGGYELYTADELKDAG